MRDGSGKFTATGVPFPASSNARTISVVGAPNAPSETACGAPSALPANCVSSVPAAQFGFTVPGSERTS